MFFRVSVVQKDNMYCFIQEFAPFGLVVRSVSDGYEILTKNGVFEVLVDSREGRSFIFIVARRSGEIGLIGYEWGTFISSYYTAQYSNNFVPFQ